MPVVAVSDDREPEPFSDEEINAVKARHPGVELRMLTAEAEAIICKRPNRAEYKRYMTFMLDADKRTSAHETLVFACAVHPDTQAIMRIFEGRPALPQLFSEKLTDWAGASVEVVEKKL